MAKAVSLDSNNVVTNIIEVDNYIPSGYQLAEYAAIGETLEETHSKRYKENRAAEYPSVNDYLDGIVKGDQAQIDAYIAACQAVKAKYPKPE